MRKTKTTYPKVHPAMIAVWAALLSVCGLLPTFPVFGTGGTFSVSYALAPLAGIMFGPWTGALTVAIGELLGTFIAPHAASIGIFTFLINTANTFAAGFMCRKKWHVGLVIMAILTAIWFVMPAGRDACSFGIVVYGLGLIMCPVGGILGTKLFSGKGIKRLIGLFLIVFPCYMVGSIVGNIFTLVLIDIPATLWNTFLIWMTPFERTVFSIAAAIIGIPLLTGLPKISIYVGPSYDNEETQDDELDREVDARIRESRESSFTDEKDR